MKKPTGTRTDDSDQTLVDVAAIDQIAKIVSKYDLSEVEVEFGEFRVRLSRERAAAPIAYAPAPPSLAPAPAPVMQSAPAERAVAAEVADDFVDAVKSPMVGTAYLRASPDAKPFVEIGAVVKPGDKLLLVEAMKTFNDILAPRGGKVTNILVTDGSPVEYGQPLIVIE